jgi:hypothetical protein
MSELEADMKPVMAAAICEDRGEAVSMMEPLLVAEGSRHRTSLTDLAIELAGRSAGLRRSLPAGVVRALVDLVRAMKCYYSNLIEGHDTPQQPDRRARHPPRRHRAGAQERLQRRPQEAQSAARG